MRDDGGDWVVIDPLGLVGDVALEALTALRDRWRSIPEQASPRRDLLSQLSAFAETSLTPLPRVVAWTQARAVRAAASDVEDDGMHAWVATQLRPRRPV